MNGPTESVWALTAHSHSRILNLYPVMPCFFFFFFFFGKAVFHRRITPLNFKTTFASLVSPTHEPPYLCSTSFTKLSSPLAHPHPGTKPINLSFRRSWQRAIDRKWSAWTSRTRQFPELDSRLGSGRSTGRRKGSASSGIDPRPLASTHKPKSPADWLGIVLGHRRPQPATSTAFVVFSWASVIWLSDLSTLLVCECCARGRVGMDSGKKSVYWRCAMKW